MILFAIAATRARRIFRDRVSLFFLVVLPVLVIVIIGAFSGGNGKFRVGIVDRSTGAFSTGLARDMHTIPGTAAHGYATLAGAKQALRRGEVDVVVDIPPGTDDALGAGRATTIGVYAEEANSTQQAAAQAVSSVIGAHGAGVQAAQFAAANAGGSVESRLDLAVRLQRSASSIGVTSHAAQRESKILPAGFSYSAPTMLVLFVFINGFTGGAAIIMTRELGMYTRMSAAPVSARQIVFGEAATYFLIAIAQAVMIILVGAIAFGVHWGDPVAAGLLVVTWAIVATGAGMLAGTLFKTREQVVAIGPPVGIALAMLGGCMWPLEIVGPAMRTIGHATPHAWAVDAWTVLLAQRGNVAGIARNLAVLAGFAVLLLGLAAIRFRRSLSA